MEFTGQYELLRRDGKWQVVLHAPRWILVDIARELNRQLSTDGLRVLSGPGLVNNQDTDTQMSSLLLGQFAETKVE